MRSLTLSLFWVLLSTPCLTALADNLSVDGNSSSVSSYWSVEGQASQLLSQGDVKADLDSSLIVSLDETQFTTQLGSSSNFGTSFGAIQLPNSNGKMLSFSVTERSNFSPVLAAKYPDIRAYRGFSLDNPQVKVYLSNAPSGLEATIVDRDAHTQTIIRKISQTDSRYIVFSELDHSEHDEHFSCSTPEPTRVKTEPGSKSHGGVNLAGEMSLMTQFSDESALTTYRLAVATNGQYSVYNGGSKQSALSAINAILTGLNFIFETDIGIRLELVGNNDEVIYLDSTTDPFDDTIDSITNVVLQSTLDSVIGSANYDIGHLFSGTGGGGNAGAIGSVCNPNYKGSAWSASTRPRGNSFVNLIAHEMGHQIGANHTFSFSSEGTGVNVEPASGSTIMSYAGTGSDDMAFYADNYYHKVSIAQSLAYLRSQSCEVSTPIENSVPVLAALADYSIPVGTPFVLTGSASDADASDTLTYTWEQTDDGVVPSSVFGPNNIQGASFRSLPPSSGGSKRYLPLLSSVVAGNLTLDNPTIGSSWETLSLEPREYNFSLTVRDNSVGGGGVAYDDMVVTVVDNDGDPLQVGAFEVTSQGLGNLYFADSPRKVTWDVAGTNEAPISVATVNITMSTDGGLTYPYQLADNVPNNGSHEVLMPDVATSTARIKVEAVGNIFYAINSQDFSLTRDGFLLTVDQLDYGVCQNNSVDASIIFESAPSFTDTSVFSAENVPIGLEVNFNPTSVSENNTPVDITFSADGDLPAGIYPVDIVATSPQNIQRLTYNIQNYSPEFEDLYLLAPVDGVLLERLNVTLQWEEQGNADSYILEIASDAEFENVLVRRTVVGGSTIVRDLIGNTLHYWRVAPNNFCGSGAPGPAYSFTTPNHRAATDLPLPIPETGANTVTSVLTVSENLRITDVNVYLEVSHTYVQDLTVTLTSPAGVSVDLLTNPCGASDDIDVVFDDEGAELACSDNTPSVSGTIRPQSGNLSIFNEQSSKGDWTLTLLDGYDLDGGSIDYLAIEIETDGEWSNTPPIALSQVVETSSQEIELTLEALDPERLPLTFSLVDLPVNGILVGPEFSASIISSNITSGSSRDVAVSSDGNTAFIADGTAGIRIFDLTNRANPIEVSSLDTTAGVARGVALSGDENTLYLANNLAGLQLVDVSNTASPALLGRYNTTGGSLDVVLSESGDTAFVADSAGGVTIVDVSNFENPTVVSTTSGSTNALDVAVSSDSSYLYVADGTAGLLVYDIQNIAEPSLVSTTATDGTASGIVLSSDNSKAYLADNSSGIVVFDLANPTSPAVDTTYSTNSSSLKLDISADNSKLYVAATNQLIILDVLDSSEISVLESLNLSGTVFAVAADSQDQTVVAATGDSGVQVLALEKVPYGAGDVISPQVTLTNESGFNDLDTFSFKVSDGQLESNVATVEVNFSTQLKSDGVYTYRQESNQAFSIIGCTLDCPQSLDIPSTIDGVAVTKIANSAFADQQSTSLTIPDSVIEIGDYAFVRSNIEKATIGSSVGAIGSSSFAYNQLKFVSFLGDKPTMQDDSFLTNRALDFISYCPGKLGWPSSISTGPTSVIPVPGCDAVNKDSGVLSEIRSAVLSGDASSISAEDLNLVIGLENVDSANIELYLGMIELRLALTFDAVRLADLQQIIDESNSAKASCSHSVYIVDVSAGLYPIENTWSLQTQVGEELYSGGSLYSELMCLVDDRYRLEMFDSNLGGTGNGWDFADFTISNESGDLLFNHSLRAGTSGLASVNVGNYPNQVPIIDGGFDTAMERGQVVTAQLVASDADDDPIEFRISAAPEYGELRAYIAGSGVIGEMFFDGGNGNLGIALTSDGQHVVLADYDTGLKIIDISNPAKPTLVGSFLFSGRLYGVTLSSDDQYAYVASDRYATVVFDISNLTNPVFVSQLFTDGSPASIVASADDQTIYIADYSHFTIGDLSDPANPVVAASVALDDNAWDIALSSDESKVFLASGGLMTIFDVSNPTIPVLLSSVETGDIARGVELSSDNTTAYLANGSSGMQIVDVSDVTAPVLGESIPSDDFMFDLVLSPDGGTLTTLGRRGNLQMINVSDPTNPIEIRTTLPGRDSWRLTLSGDGETAYVADGYSGFKAIDIGYTARSLGTYVESDVTYVHTANSSINDFFAVKANDGLDDSDAAIFRMNFMADADGDGIGDEDDNCPNTANVDQLDTDGDSQGDACDEDDDNDGVPDSSDAFPVDSGESVDTDGDGTGNNADSDDDGDTVEDTLDNCPLIANTNQLDTDGDLTGNLCDGDDDNDGVADDSDAFPLDNSETVDSDGDGVGDNSDWAPNDSSESADSDGDGVGDNADAFPSDATETLDTDSDGVGDNTDPDIDGDGVLNENDPFPNQGQYSVDTDSDGMPDAWEIRFDLDPNDPLDAALDQDGDGITNLEEFLAGTPPSGSIDIDGNSRYDALTDGLLLLRGMFGLTDSALVAGAVASDAVYSSSSEIESRISLLSDLADVDGNGEVDALTDGLLTLRYLFGLQGSALVSGVVAPNATRTSAAEIEAHLEGLTPTL